MTIKVIIKGREVKMTRKEFLRRFGDRRTIGTITKKNSKQCQS